MHPSRLACGVALAAALALPVVSSAWAQGGPSMTPSSRGTAMAPARPAAPNAMAPAAPNAMAPAPSGGMAAQQQPGQNKLIDINSASAGELDALPGIGPSRADAIVQNRPYKSKNDLLTRHIVPKNVYENIKDKIVARQG